MIPQLGPVRLEFVLFALTLVGVALFHTKTMWVALGGLLSVLIFKWIFIPDFSLFTHILGGHGHEGEWRTLVNLLGLLFGFAILAKHFEESNVPEILPRYLPGGYWGSVTLLFFVMVISSFLDNIAAAMIGGTIALVVFQGRVHMGYLAGIVAASNAGGAPSVVGDTTTTLMWIDGVSKLIRPLITLQWVVLLYPGVIITTFILLIQSNVPVVDALGKVFGDPEKAVVSFILGNETAMELVFYGGNLDLSRRYYLRFAGRYFDVIHRYGNARPGSVMETESLYFIQNLSRFLVTQDAGAGGSQFLDA